MFIPNLMKLSYVVQKLKWGGGGHTDSILSQNRHFFFQKESRLKRKLWCRRFVWLLGKPQASYQWSGSGPCTVTLNEKLQPGRSLHCTGKQCCFFCVYYKEAYPCIFTWSGEECTVHSQKMYFALRYTDLSAFIKPTKCIWLVEHNHVNLKTLQLFLVTLVLNYVMFQNAKIFVWTLYSNISSFFRLFALVEPLLLDRTLLGYGVCIH
jgi:hypothetical protein